MAQYLAQWGLNGHAAVRIWAWVVHAQLIRMISIFLDALARHAAVSVIAIAIRACLSAHRHGTCYFRDTFSLRGAARESRAIMSKLTDLSSLTRHHLAWVLDLVARAERAAILIV